MAAKKYSRIKHVQENSEWEGGRQGMKYLFSYAATKGKQASRLALVSIEMSTAGALIIRMFVH